MSLAGDAFSWNRNQFDFQASESELIKKNWNRNQFFCNLVESQESNYFWTHQTRNPIIPEASNHLIQQRQQEK